MCDTKLFKKVEDMLTSYNETKIEIKNLKLDLEILENNYIGATGITYTEKTGETNKFNSSVENEVMKREDEILRLKNKIKIKEIQIQKIDNIMDDSFLTNDEVFIIKERYFNKRSNKYIAALLNVAEETSSDYKNKLIERLIPLLINAS